jgi:hypothetical protein
LKLLSLRIKVYLITIMIIIWAPRLNCPNSTSLSCCTARAIKAAGLSAISFGSTGKARCYQKDAAPIPGAAPRWAKCLLLTLVMHVDNTLQKMFNLQSRAFRPLNGLKLHLPPGNLSFIHLTTFKRTQACYAVTIPCG